jgi:hypothetical protein
VIGDKLIAVWSQSISGVSAVNPLFPFYDIHRRKRCRRQRCYSFIWSRITHETRYIISYIIEKNIFGWCFSILALIYLLVIKIKQILCLPKWNEHLIISVIIFFTVNSFLWGVLTLFGTWVSIWVDYVSHNFVRSRVVSGTELMNRTLPFFHGSRKRRPNN